MPDGSIVFSTALDNKKLEAELSRLKREISSLERQISKTESVRSPLVDKAEQIRKSMAAATAEAERYKSEWISGSVGADKNEMAAREQVAQLNGEYENVLAQIEKYDDKLADSNRRLEKAKEEAGGLCQMLEQAGDGGEKLANATKKAEKHGKSFSSRLKSILAGAFVFNVLSAGLRQFTSWMGKMIKSNDEARAAIAKLKGALLTLAQPIIKFVVPAFIALINILAKIVAIIASLISRLFGTTAEEAADAAEGLYEEAGALDSVGGAAKRAKRALASFDEINRLTHGTESAGTNSDKIVPDFSDFKNGFLSSLTFTLDDIFFKWENLTAEDIMAKLFTGLTTIAGLFVGYTVGGPLGAVVGMMAGATLGMILSNLTFDGDGEINREELFKSIIAALGMLTGAVLGFAIGGPGGAAIGVFIGAAATIGLNKLLFNNDGEMSQAELADTLKTALAALAGFVVGFIAGGPGGALIGMIISTGAVLSLGSIDTNGDGQVSTDEFVGLLIKALPIVAGAAIGFAVGGPGGAALGVTIGTGVTLLLEKVLWGNPKYVNSESFDAGKWIGKCVKDGTRESLGIHSPSTEYELIGEYMMQGMVDGITKNSDKVSMSVQNVLSGIQLSYSMWQTSFMIGWNAFQTVFQEQWKSFWSRIHAQFAMNWNGILSSLQKGVNNAIKGLNELVSAANSLSDLTASRYMRVPQISIPKIEVPQLAAGAVIPPNREFMAVLGDQKSGTNIEAPLSTIERAVENVLSRRSYSNDGENVAYLYVGEDVFGKLVYKANKRESNRMGVTLVEGTL